MSVSEREMIVEYMVWKAMSVTLCARFVYRFLKIEVARINVIDSFFLYASGFLYLLGV